MARKQKLIPAYFKWRDGRPRWEPGPGLRARGWSGQDLKDEAGDWLEMGAAMTAAAALNARTKSAGANRARETRTATQRSCRALFARFWTSPDFQRLGDKTQADYRNKANVFLASDFADAPVAALRKPHCVGWWEELYNKRGHAMANGVVAVVRRVFSYAELIGWRAENSNPFMALKRPSVPPRCVVFSPSEIAALVATGDGADMLRDGFGPSTVDAMVIALHTGQRLGDVIALSDDGVLGGRSVFHQAKRGSRVSVPQTDQLTARLADMRRRRSALKVETLATAKILVINERTGQPYTANQLSKAFRRLRDAAATDAPTLAGKLFLDLRDTAITRLALAGCTVPEIRAITGHSMATIHDVLKHYLVLDDRMADAAIDRLKQWMTDEGIAV